LEIRGSAGAGGFGLVPKDPHAFPTLIDFIAIMRSSPIARAAAKSSASTRPRRDFLVQRRKRPCGCWPARLYEFRAAGCDDGFLRDTAGRRHSLRGALTLAGADTDIAFNGTLMEPLDFEGVRSELSIRCPHAR